MSDFPDHVILEYPSGGAELALPLPENVRKYCITAAQFFKQGKVKAAKDIFISLLKLSVPPSLAGRLKRYSVTDLALLAAHLLNSKSTDVLSVVPETVNVRAVEKSMQRLLAKVR